MPTDILLLHLPLNFLLLLLCTLSFLTVCFIRPSTRTRCSFSCYFNGPSPHLFPTSSHGLHSPLFHCLPFFSALSLSLIVPQWHCFFLSCYFNVPSSKRPPALNLLNFLSLFFFSSIFTSYSRLIVLQFTLQLLLSLP